MNKLIPALVFFTLLGAGCGGEATPALPAGRSPLLCTAEPETSDIGALIYPINSKYEKLGYLGQIFTALDCKDPERAKRIFGFEGENYVAGITLTWGADGPSINAQAVLSNLGFTKTADGVWHMSQPLTIDALQELRQLFQNPAELDRLQSTDCINCG